MTRVMDALQTVYDPEIPVSIVELGGNYGPYAVDVADLPTDIDSFAQTPSSATKSKPAKVPMR